MTFDKHQSQGDKSLSNSQSSPDELPFSQVAPGNIAHFESYSHSLPVITDHASRSDISSSDPTLATYLQ